MNLDSLQNGLNQMKEIVERAITTRTFIKANGELSRVYANGNSALKACQQSTSHIQPIHESVKLSLTSEFQDRGEVANHLFPPIGERMPEIVVPGWKNKTQDIVITFGETEDFEGNILAGPDIETAIVVGIRSQLKSVQKNKDTIIERTVAEPFLTRFAHVRITMGELFILPVEEYLPHGQNSTNVGYTAVSTLTGMNVVEWYLDNFLRMANRTDVNDWRHHLRYERACIVIVRMEEDLPRFYRTLQEMHVDEIVSEEFYNANHEAYDQHLSPVNFARDLVAAHRERWPLLYAANEHQ